ncbi:MAG: MFS transporter [Brevefilum sp.]|nr:MFS transporter [Brevefilum sp.]MDT8381646.1 MFS transporter [Brevefilum sp.]
MSISSIKIKLHIFLFTLARTIINTNYRMVYPFLPVFAKEMGVATASLAMAFSVRSFLGVFGPFLATIADTHDRKTGILLGVGLFTAGSGVVGIFPNFWGFVAGTSLVLLGNGVFIPSLNAYLGDNVPFEKRGRVLAITELSWALAFIGGIPLVGLLLESFIWVTPFLIFTIIGALLFLLFAWILPSNRIQSSEGNNIKQNFGRILRTWPALAGLLAGILFTGANETVNLIFGVWIEDQFGLNFAALAIASVVIGVSELGGEVFSAVWLDAIGKRRVIWIFLGVNSLAALLLPLTDGVLAWALVGLGLFYISFEIVLVSALTLMSEVVPSARATMIAATVAGFSLGRMLGDLIAPGLYSISFWLCCLAAVGLNALAAGLMTQVRVE